MTTLSAAAIAFTAILIRDHQGKTGSNGLWIAIVLYIASLFASFNLMNDSVKSPFIQQNPDDALKKPFNHAMYLLSSGGFFVATILVLFAVWTFAATPQPAIPAAPPNTTTIPANEKAPTGEGRG